MKRPLLRCIEVPFAFMILLGATIPMPAEEPLRVLIIDGQNEYHDWQVTTPLMREYLESTGRFAVDVATTPPPRHDMSDFGPQFDEYDVVLGNYHGDPWPEETRAAFESFVRGGGGYVVVHAANNAFPDWSEYNEMTGLGGWYDRNENWGPYVYYRDGEVVRDDSPGPGGHHGPQHEYTVTLRDTEHPITKGLPTEWLHTKDELYDRLRGPAANMHILATAYSDPEFEGTGRDEPMLMVLDYGQGRVFHTVLGHADYSMRCVGFLTTLARGTEWAATGKVTQPVPEDFPTATETSSWKSE